MTPDTSPVEITYRIAVKMDDIAVRGNAIASGDPEVDKAVEDKILRRLERGDTWAWAHVTVFAECQGWQGRDDLGGCSYENEADFKADGYYEDMKVEARHGLVNVLRHAVRSGADACALLAALGEMP